MRVAYESILIGDSRRDEVCGIVVKTHDEVHLICAPRSRNASAV